MEHTTNPAQDSQRAYVRVIDYIKQEIRVGNLTIGSRLPPERTLAELLNVGRNSVREALRILEIMGIITSTQGAGHFIAGNFEIQNFFRTYKTLQNKVTEVGEFFGVERACAILDESFIRFAEGLRP